ncbi:hypothetical protein GRS48_09200 [Halorubrum sp. JWXQ-INN 858]|uniref:hypothetical protein n=1 Tax=Halorubrum sp. JWXQ-INN 858 TaxID=2690782 RepID=UPI001358D2C6|nr:hypothetical protein [Halorubrum sp. JWXQ-INN 858]MWV64992.1 hypothetical protein [Halorubrum sp. JWXQ-INN 858]
MRVRPRLPLPTLSALPTLPTLSALPTLPTLPTLPPPHHLTIHRPADPVTPSTTDRARRLSTALADYRSTTDRIHRLSTDYRPTPKSTMTTTAPRPTTASRDHDDSSVPPNSPPDPIHSDDR